MAHRQLSYLPGIELFVYGQMDTKSRIGRVKAPVLVVQCSRDPVIPPELGQQVYEAASSPKQLLKFEMTCHEESSLIAPFMYQTALRDFLSKAANAK